MKKLLLLVSTLILLWSCEDKPSLQKYFVKNTESPKFIALDLASNIIKTDKVALSETEKAALESFEKMNILAFRTDSTDITGYEKEIKEVKTIWLYVEYSG